MACVPGAHGHSHGNGLSDPRYSLDVDKLQYGPKPTTSSRRVSADYQHMGPTAINLLDKAKKAHVTGEMRMGLAVYVTEKDIHARAAPAASPFDFNDEALARLQHM